jgi:two-component system, NarL family, nitrate/nitrite response regulator NarL
MGDDDWNDPGLRSLFSGPGVEPRTFHLPRVFIVSDVRLCREGLALSLASRQSVGVVGSASAAEALQRVALVQPDVVVLGAEVDPALDLPRRLRERAPGVKTIAIAASDAEQDLLAWAEAGASAYAGPDCSADDLVDIVHQVLRGELVCPPRLTALLFGRIAALSAGQVRESAGAALTQREREIVPLLEEGLSNKEIARRLTIGSATVKNHVHNILEKLQVSRRGEISARLRRSRGRAAAAVQPTAERWPA